MADDEDSENSEKPSVKDKLKFFESKPVMQAEKLRPLSSEVKAEKSKNEDSGDVKFETEKEEDREEVKQEREEEKEEVILGKRGSDDKKGNSSDERDKISEDSETTCSQKKLVKMDDVDITAEDKSVAKSHSGLEASSETDDDNESDDGEDTGTNTKEYESETDEVCSDFGSKEMPQEHITEKENKEIIDSPSVLGSVMTESDVESKTFDVLDQRPVSEQSINEKRTDDVKDETPSFQILDDENSFSVIEEHGVSDDVTKFENSSKGHNGKEKEEVVEEEEDQEQDEKEAGEEGPEVDEQGLDDKDTEEEAQEVEEQNTFFDAVEDQPFAGGSPVRIEKDEEEEEEEDERDRQLWEIPHEEHPEMSRSEQENMWKTTDGSFIVIEHEDKENSYVNASDYESKRANFDTQSEDRKLPVSEETNSDEKLPVSEETNSDDEFDNDLSIRREDTEILQAASLDYTLYENVENNLIEESRPENWKLGQSTSSNGGDGDKFTICLKPVKETGDKYLPSPTNEVKTAEEVSESVNVPESNSSTPVDKYLPSPKDEVKTADEVSESLNVPESNSSTPVDSSKSAPSDTVIKDGTVYQNWPQPPPVPERKPVHPAKRSVPFQSTVYQNVEPPKIPERSYRSSVNIGKQTKDEGNDTSIKSAPTKPQVPSKPPPLAVKPPVVARKSHTDSTPDPDMEKEGGNKKDSNRLSQKVVGVEVGKLKEKFETSPKCQKTDVGKDIKDIDVKESISDDEEQWHDADNRLSKEDVESKGRDIPVHVENVPQASTEHSDVKSYKQHSEDQEQLMPESQHGDDQTYKQHPEDHQQFMPGSQHSNDESYKHFENQLQFMPGSQPSMNPEFQTGPYSGHFQQGPGPLGSGQPFLPPGGFGPVFRMQGQGWPGYGPPMQPPPGFMWNPFIRNFVPYPPPSYQEINTTHEKPSPNQQQEKAHGEAGGFPKHKQKPQPPQKQGPSNRGSEHKNVKQKQHLEKGAQEAVKGEPTHKKVSKKKEKQTKPKKPLNGLVCVRGIAEKTVHDTLCDFMDLKADVDVDRSAVIYSEDERSAVVPFLEPIVFSRLSTGISKRQLDGSMLEVCEVPHPRCIIVSCDKEMPSDSVLSNYFQSHKSGGGHVEKCQEVDGLHVIYFRDEEAVDRVCEATRVHKIGNAKLTVTPFYITDFGNFWNLKKHKVALPGHIEITDIDPDVKTFIRNSAQTIAEINQELKPKYAKLTIVEDLIIECLLDQKTPNVRKIVKDWRSQIQEVWRRYVEDATLKAEINVAEEVWPHLQVCVGNISIEDESKVIVLSRRGELKLVFVGHRNVVETLKENVEEKKIGIETQLDRKRRRREEKKELRPAEVCLLESENAFDGINDIAEDFEFSFDRGTGVLCYIGVPEDIASAQVKIMETLNTFSHFDVENDSLSPGQFQLLSNQKVQHMVKEELVSKAKKAEFDVSRERIRVYLTNEGDKSLVLQTVLNITGEEKIDLDENSINVLKKQVWKSTVNKLQSENKDKMILKASGDFVVVTATSDVLQNIKDILDEVIEKNTIIQDKLHIQDIGKMKFISKHCEDCIHDLENDLQDDSVNIKIGDNGIEVSGTKGGIKQVRTAVEEALLPSIKNRQHDINKPGIGKVICPENVHQIQEIEGETKTVIIQDYKASPTGASGGLARQESVDDGPDESDMGAFERENWTHRSGVHGKLSKTQVLPTTQPKVISLAATASIVTPPQPGQVKCQNGTTIYLVKGELAKEKGDVIVCTTSKDLNLTAGKAGENLLKVGGPTIQADCKQNYPQGIQFGDVAVVSGGNLNCKQVYFGSLPEWHNESGKSVKTITTFMNNCLAKAQQSGYTSILFAALGTGALGYPRDEAARLMYKCVMDFDKANPGSKLKSVKFIVFNKDSLTVDAFEQEEMGHINPAFKQAIKKGPITSKHGMKISIVKGSLGQQQADILVCAVPKDLSLTSGAASKSLLQYGSESIQVECQTKFPKGISKDGEIAEVGGGKLSCKGLYLTSIPGWEGEKNKPDEEKVVYKVVSACLERASKFGYKTIAIPAMGTGKINYPKKTVAQLFYRCAVKFSEKHPKSSIQSVMFVVFPKDLETVKEFEKEEQNRLNPATKYSSGSSSVVTPRCGIKISITTTSLANEKADVIVCSTSPQLDLNSGQASKALLQAGGQSLQDECQLNYGGIDEGEIAVVGPGKLCCQSVYFGCLPKHSANPQAAEKILSEFMLRCLDLAASDGMTSIAFSSMGTGGNGYPHSVVAKIMYQAILTFDGKSPTSSPLKKVHFAIYAKDHKSLQAFQAEQSRYPSSRATTVSAPAPVMSKTFVDVQPHASHHQPAKKEFDVGKMTLRFCHGDITTQKVDVIVNSTNEDLDFSRGGVSAAIKKKCDKSLETECSKKASKMKSKKIISTSGCGLQCKKIIHVESQDSLNDWKKMMLKCLEKAEKNKFSTIAFPAVGTGKGFSTFKPEAIAEVFYEAVVEHHHKGGNKHLQVVKVVVFAPEDENKMVAAVNNVYRVSDIKDKKGFLDRVKHGLKGFAEDIKLIPRKGVTSKPSHVKMNSVSLWIFYDSDDNFDKAVRELKKLVDNKVTKQTIDDTLIPELKDKEKHAIKNIGKKYHLHLEINNQNATVEIEGVKADVLDAGDKIYEMLRDYQMERHIDAEAKIVKEKVQWYWKEITGSGTNLQPYPPRINMLLEDKNKHQDQSVEFNAEDGQYVVDFQTMQEYPKSNPTDTVDVIRREMLKGSNVELPANWSDMSKTTDNIQLITVQSSTQEYKTLEQRFIQSVLNGKFKDRFSQASLKVKKIERVQNKHLYQQYQVKKTQLENQNPQGTTNERELWHGTSSTVTDSINYYGFNRSYCGGAGHGGCWFGDGVYFSNDGSYSARAWLSQGHGPGAANIAIGGAQKGFTGQVYLAKVLTGEFLKGSQGMRFLPGKPTGYNYDCAVDDIQNPVEFIIFNDTQAYPDYIITFDT